MQSGNSICKAREQKNCINGHMSGNNLILYIFCPQKRSSVIGRASFNIALITFKKNYFNVIIKEQEVMKLDNEKLFELMEKMYSEMKNGFEQVDKRFGQVDKRFDGIEERLHRLENGQFRLENELMETKKTLYDGYIQNSEAISRIETKLDELSDKVDKHDIKIQVIEGGKKAL